MSFATRANDKTKLLVYVASDGTQHDVLDVRDGKVYVNEDGVRIANAYWRHGALGAALTKAFAAHQKAKIGVMITGLSEKDAQAAAAKLARWTPTITDPADPSRTIPNPQTPQDALKDHIEGMLLEVIENNEAEEDAKAAADAARLRVRDRLETTKPNRARGSQ